MTVDATIFIAHAMMSNEGKGRSQKGKSILRGMMKVKLDFTR